MVQESRSLLIQQLLQGGFKEEDDDDEDEDESHELTKRHPSGISGERQGFGRQDHVYQKDVVHVISETRETNKVARDGVMMKQVVPDFESKFSVDRQNLLASKSLKDAKSDLQSSLENCLQPEQEIIREGSKRLLQIHSEILDGKYPLVHHMKGPEHEPETTLKDSKYFSKTCCMVQKQQLKGGEGPPQLATRTESVSKNYGDSGIDTIEEAQQSHEPVIKGQYALQFALTKSVAAEASSQEEEIRRRCFAALNNTKNAARELDVNIPIPNISTDLEKKASISGCTVSLAMDQGSSTDSVNGNDEFIHDVTSADRAAKYDELDVPKGGHFDVLQSSKVKEAVEPTVCINRAKELILKPQQVEFSATAFGSTQFGKNQEPETSDRTNDCPIDMTSEGKRAENKFHVCEEKHDEFLSEIHETVSEKARFRSSVFEYSTAKVIDETSTVQYSSKIAVEEYPSEEKEFQQRDELSASNNRTCNVQKTPLIEPFLKTRTDAASLRTYLSEDVNPGGVPVAAGNNIEDGGSLENIVSSESEKTHVVSSPMNTSKKQSVNIAHLDTTYSADSESETIKFTSSEDKRSSHVVQAPLSTPIEAPVSDTHFLVNPPAQDVYVSSQMTPTRKSISQVNTRDVTLGHSEVITPTTSSSLNHHSTFAVQGIPLQSLDQTGLCTPDPVPTQSVETIPVELNIPTAESVQTQPLYSDAVSSPFGTTPPKESPKVHTTTAPVNVTNKEEKPRVASLNVNSNGKAGTSRQKSKKKKVRMQQDARTVVFVRSDTRVAYNGPQYAHSSELPLPQDGTQHNTMPNVINPSLYNFANTQSTQAFMRQETDRHLMQAQTTAQEAMVSATSALAQSHYEWSQMQNQIFCPGNSQRARSHLTIMREAQIASISATVAAAAVVAKAAVEAARAIQEASKELDGLSQPNFGQSGFARSAEMPAYRQGLSEMTSCQPPKFENPSKVNTAGHRKKDKLRASSAPKDEVKINDRTQQIDLQCLSHAEVRDPKAEPSQPKASDLLGHSDQKGAGVVRFTKGASSGDESDEAVEISL